MASAPNQQFVDIHRTQPSLKGHLSINTNEWNQAFQILSPSGFGLYLYLADKPLNTKGWLLSKAAVMNQLNFSEASYKRAKKDLIDHGYLVDKGRNHFDFFTTPSKEPVSSLQVKNDPVVSTQQESMDIGVKNDPKIRVKNDLVIGSKMTLETNKTGTNNITDQSPPFGGSRKQEEEEIELPTAEIGTRDPRLFKNGEKAFSIVSSIDSLIRLNEDGKTYILTTQEEVDRKRKA